MASRPDRVRDLGAGTEVEVTDANLPGATGVTGVTGATDATDEAGATDESDATDEVGATDGGGERTPPVHPLRRLRQSNPWIFGTMLFSALISLTASFVLSVDAIVLAADPQAALACNINAVLSCGTVGASWQASLFGFPNAFLGLVAEPVVITIAVASLGGVRFPRWFMFSAQIVYTLGLIFAYWLFFQACFVIGALCPWCLLVTLSTTLVFTSLTHVNIRDGNLYLPERVTRTARTLIAHDLDLLLVTLWLVGITAMVVIKYVPLML